MLTLGIEGGPCDGEEITVPVAEHGQRAGRIELGGEVYVLRMFGAEPRPAADWHYCHQKPHA